MGNIFLIAFLFVQNPDPSTQSNTEKDPAVPVQADKTPAAAETPPQQAPGEVLLPSQTKHLPSTGRRIVTNFWSDQKAIWSSPFHMSRSDTKWWAILGTGTAALIATDRETSKALPNTVHQVSFSRNVSQIGAVYTTLPVAGTLYLIGRARDDPHAREAGVLGTQALLDSFIVVSIMKYGAGRERPDQIGGNGRFFKGQRSFPSGHAMMSWSFASLISHEYKGGKVIPTVAYSLAGMVSVARFTAQKHYASDIIAGGSMGWFIGKFVFDHHLDKEIHKRYDSTHQNSLMPEISPTYDPRHKAYAVSLGWTP